MARPQPLRVVAALLLVLATIVFVIGVSIERAGPGDKAAGGLGASESSEVSSQEVGEEIAEEGEAGHREGESAEGESARAAVAAGPESEEAGGHAESETAHDEGSETILGVDPESTAAVAAAVALSLLVSAALWLWGAPVVLVVAALFALVFAALDGRELLHQLVEARQGLAIVALLAAILHVGVAATAGLAFMRRDLSPAATGEGASMSTTSEVRDV